MRIARDSFGGELKYMMFQMGKMFFARGVIDFLREVNLV